MLQDTKYLLWIRIMQVISQVMKNVLASAAEAKLGAPFIKCVNAIAIRNMLKELTWVACFMLISLPYRHPNTYIAISVSGQTTTT